jgi:hypothetical protein
VLVVGQGAQDDDFGLYFWPDADGDGRLTTDDYFRIDRGRAQRLTGFANGDFDYSGGPPDADDFMIIDRAFLAGFGTSQAALPPISPFAAPPPDEQYATQDPLWGDT